MRAAVAILGPPPPAACVASSTLRTATLTRSSPRTAAATPGPALIRPVRPPRPRWSRATLPRLSLRWACRTPFSCGGVGKAVVGAKVEHDRKHGCECERAGTKARTHSGACGAQILKEKSAMDSCKSSGLPQVSSQARGNHAAGAGADRHRPPVALSQRLCIRCLWPAR